MREAAGGQFGKGIRSPQSGLPRVRVCWKTGLAGNPLSPIRAHVNSP